MRVLVTGGAGFIGSNVANHLADRHEVVAIDDESLGDPTPLRNTVDYRRRSVLEDDLPTDVDVVFHLAARSSYAMHERDPADGARVNVEGFINTLEQAREDGCECVVYASTSSVYGDRTAPVSETASVEASSGYEASMLARERYAEYVAAHYGTTIAGVRLFSIYQGYHGAEGHKGPYANVVTQFADDIARGDSPALYGDGSQTRDFVHVDDVVRGLEAVADAGLTGIYNLGTGTAHSFVDVVDLLTAELESDVEPVFVENPIPEDVYVHDTRADVSALRRETGWEPTVSLEEGVRRVCEPYL
ncbi:NAD-dependent epimerase/dehydratase family protein [Natronorubrum sp. DTA28]|uniref:NAD-dependent epimerase/dehydratase family protein n=1 Tax=Natronorubrum sp. DTA28 TaxID=3447019 RepID=UPI003F860195